MLVNDYDRGSRGGGNKNIPKTKELQDEDPLNIFIRQLNTLVDNIEDDYVPVVQVTAISKSLIHITTITRKQLNAYSTSKELSTRLKNEYIAPFKTSIQKFENYIDTYKRALAKNQDIRVPLTSFREFLNKSIQLLANISTIATSLNEIPTSRNTNPTTSLINNVNAIALMYSMIRDTLTDTKIVLSDHIPQPQPLPTNQTSLTEQMVSQYNTPDTPPTADPTPDASTRSNNTKKTTPQTSHINAERYIKTPITLDSLRKEVAGNQEYTNLSDIFRSLTYAYNSVSPTADNEYKPRVFDDFMSNVLLFLQSISTPDIVDTTRLEEILHTYNRTYIPINDSRIDSLKSILLSDLRTLINDILFAIENSDFDYTGIREYFEDLYLWVVDGESEAPYYESLRLMEDDNPLKKIIKSLRATVVGVKKIFEYKPPSKSLERGSKETISRFTYSDILKHIPDGSLKNYIESYTGEYFDPALEGLNQTTPKDQLFEALTNLNSTLRFISFSIARDQSTLKYLKQLKVVLLTKVDSIIQLINSSDLTKEEIAILQDTAHPQSDVYEELFQTPPFSSLDQQPSDEHSTDSRTQKIEYLNNFRSKPPYIDGNPSYFDTDYGQPIFLSELPEFTGYQNSRELPDDLEFTKAMNSEQLKICTTFSIIKEMMHYLIITNPRKIDTGILNNLGESSNSSTDSRLSLADKYQVPRQLIELIPFNLSTSSLPETMIEIFVKAYSEYYSISEDSDRTNPQKIKFVPKWISDPSNMQELTNTRDNLTTLLTDLKEQISVLKMHLSANIHSDETTSPIPKVMIMNDIIHSSDSTTPITKNEIYRLKTLLESYKKLTPSIVRVQLTKEDISETAQVFLAMTHSILPGTRFVKSIYPQLVDQNEYTHTTWDTAGMGKLIPLDTKQDDSSERLTMEELLQIIAEASGGSRNYIASNSKNSDVQNLIKNNAQAMEELREYSQLCRNLATTVILCSKFDSIKTFPPLLRTIVFTILEVLASDKEESERDEFYDRLLVNVDRTNYTINWTEFLLCLSELEYDSATKLVNIIDEYKIMMPHLDIDGGISYHPLNLFDPRFIQAFTAPDESLPTSAHPRLTRDGQVYFESGFSRGYTRDGQDSSLADPAINRGTTAQVASPLQPSLRSFRRGDVSNKDRSPLKPTPFSITSPTDTTHPTPRSQRQNNFVHGDPILKQTPVDFEQIREFLLATVHYKIVDIDGKHHIEFDSPDSPSLISILSPQIVRFVQNEVINKNQVLENVFSPSPLTVLVLYLDFLKTCEPNSKIINSLTRIVELLINDHKSNQSNSFKQGLAYLMELYREDEGNQELYSLLTDQKLLKGVSLFQLTNQIDEIIKSIIRHCFDFGYLIDKHDEVPIIEVQSKHYLTAPEALTISLTDISPIEQLTTEQMELVNRIWESNGFIQALQRTYEHLDLLNLINLGGYINPPSQFNVETQSPLQRLSILRDNILLLKQSLHLFEVFLTLQKESDFGNIFDYLTVPTVITLEQLGDLVSEFSSSAQQFFEVVYSIVTTMPDYSLNTKPDRTRQLQCLALVTNNRTLNTRESFTNYYFKLGFNFLYIVGHFSNDVRTMMLNYFPEIDQASIEWDKVFPLSELPDLNQLLPKFVPLMHIIPYISNTTTKDSYGYFIANQLEKSTSQNGIFNTSIASAVILFVEEELGYDNEGEVRYVTHFKGFGDYEAKINQYYSTFISPRIDRMLEGLKNGSNEGIEFDRIIEKTILHIFKSNKTMINLMYDSICSDTSTHLYKWFSTYFDQNGEWIPDSSNYLDDNNLVLVKVIADYINNSKHPEYIVKFMQNFFPYTDWQWDQINSRNQQQSPQNVEIYENIRPRFEQCVQFLKSHSILYPDMIDSKELTVDGLKTLDQDKWNVIWKTLGRRLKLFDSFILTDNNDRIAMLGQYKSKAELFVTQVELLMKYEYKLLYQYEGITPASSHQKYTIFRIVIQHIFDLVKDNPDNNVALIAYASNFPLLCFLYPEKIQKIKEIYPDFDIWGNVDRETIDDLINEALVSENGVDFTTYSAPSAMLRLALWHQGIRVYPRAFVDADAKKTHIFLNIVTHKMLSLYDRDHTTVFGQVSLEENESTTTNAIKQVEDYITATLNTTFEELESDRLNHFYGIMSLVIELRDVNSYNQFTTSHPNSKPEDIWNMITSNDSSEIQSKFREILVTFAPDAQWPWKATINQNTPSEDSQTNPADWADSFTNNGLELLQQTGLSGDKDFEISPERADFYLDTISLLTSPQYEENFQSYNELIDSIYQVSETYKNKKIKVEIQNEVWNVLYTIHRENWERLVHPVLKKNDIHTLSPQEQIEKYRLYLTHTPPCVPYEWLTRMPSNLMHSGAVQWAYNQYPDNKNINQQPKRNTTNSPTLTNPAYFLETLFNTHSLSPFLIDVHFSQIQDHIILEYLALAKFIPPTTNQKEYISNHIIRFKTLIDKVDKPGFIRYLRVRSASFSEVREFVEEFRLLIKDLESDDLQSNYIKKNMERINSGINVGGSNKSPSSNEITLTFKTTGPTGVSISQPIPFALNLFLEFTFKSN